MKRLAICAALLSAAPGLMQASGVISTMSCGGTYALTASATCGGSTYQDVLEQFQDSLQWNSSNDITSPTLSATNINDPAMANGGVYNTTWDAVDLPISVTGSSLELADNYLDVQRGTHWSPATGSHAQTFGGNFDTQPDNSGFAAGTPGASGTPGDYLLGSNSSSPITIASTAPLSSFGFRIESEDLHLLRCRHSTIRSGWRLPWHRYFL